MNETLHNLDDGYDGQVAIEPQGTDSIGTSETPPSANTEDGADRPNIQEAGEVHDNSEQVEDFSKAWDMAHSAINSHESARYWSEKLLKMNSQIEAAVDAAKLFMELLQKNLDNERLLSSVPEDSEEYLRLKREIDDFYSIKNNAKEKIKLLNESDREFQEFAVHFADMLGLYEKRLPRLGQKVSERYNDNISWNEKNAEGIEEWAGIMHDHPVSESYRQSHPEINFEPREIFLLERQAEKDAKAVEELESLILKFDLDIGIRGIPSIFEDKDGQRIYTFDLLDEAGVSNIRSYEDKTVLKAEEVMAEAFGGHEPDEKEITYYTYIHQKFAELRPDRVKAIDKWIDYRKLRNDPNTNLGQLRDNYIAAFRVAYVEQKRAYVDMVKTITEDITSGRASEETPLE